MRVFQRIYLLQEDGFVSSLSPGLLLCWLLDGFIKPIEFWLGVRCQGTPGCWMAWWKIVAALWFHHAGFAHREHGSDGSFHRILERFWVLRVLRVLRVRDNEKRKTGQGSLFERDCEVQNCLIFSLILFSLIVFVKTKVVRLSVTDVFSTKDMP